MALGFNVNFLKKTAGAQQMGGAQQAGAAQQANPANNTAISNALSGGDKAQGAQQQKDMTQMSTSDLMKHVYGNMAGQEQEAKANFKPSDKEQKAYNLPATVEYNNEKFSANGQDLEKTAAEIAKKTGDSQSKVETELKKKYANPAASKKGLQLNMNA